ncbi:MAG TPA: permease prefix domain 1-containing protein [Solirubrobacteraceae bacterium]
MNPIYEYLRELSALLRRSRRRRIVAEVRAHLMEAAAAHPLHATEPELAARHAVERFGPPARVAGQFNALRRRPLALAQRVTAVMLACAGMGSLGAATVWALEPGTAQAHRSSQATHVHSPAPAARP